MDATSALYYIAFCAANVAILKEVNSIVIEPYMDEPFHVPQAQAYCRNEWSSWDAKITTPPGLYVLSFILKHVFMFKCNLSMLRLTPMFALLSLPSLLMRLLAFHQRSPPSQSILSPPLEAVVLATFPVAWFFGFLYYTDVPSLAFSLATIVAATEERHVLAGFLGILSCTFRQTNIIWVVYAFVISQLFFLRFQRSKSGSPPSPKPHDPPALEASPFDLLQSFISLPAVLPSIIRASVPYMICLLAFAIFIIWNGGVALGDKSNHIPTFHVPQLYYFIGFATALGWPTLLSYNGGPLVLIKDVRERMIGSTRRTLTTALLAIGIAWTIYKFTIQHPFLLSDNRHYTFYIWRRIFHLHPAIPYLLAPGYLACAWAWFLRVGKDQTLLQTLALPFATLPVLLMTPLLEPRYFIIPYILLRVQVPDAPTWSVVLEGFWYIAINFVTMFVFLYKERPNVGRFMW